LIDEIKNKLPWSPSQHLNHLVKDLALTPKDAKTLIYYEGGDLLSYYYEVKKSAHTHITQVQRDSKHAFDGFNDYARVAANWVIHNLLGTLTKEKLTFEENPVPADKLGNMVQLVLDKMLSNGNAKKLLERLIFQPKPTDVATNLETIARDEGLIVTPATDAEVKAVLESIFADEKDAKIVKARLEIKMLQETIQKVDVDEQTKAKSEKRRAGLENMFLGMAMKKLGTKGQPDKVGRVLKEVIKADLEKE
jgi:Asp-tRNA(Asn)/Glu-tRNA(Gln) amidotransferase B subunit